MISWDFTWDFGERKTEIQSWQRVLAEFCGEKAPRKLGFRMRSMLPTVEIHKADGIYWDQQPLGYKSIKRRDRGQRRVVLIGL